MKGELEDAVKALEFDHTVILRPGLIVGNRQETRFGEAVGRKLAGLAGALGNAFKDPWAQVCYRTLQTFIESADPEFRMRTL